MIELIPQNFSDSVKYFIEFFKIKITRPDYNSLKNILEHFSTIPYENISKIIKLSKTWSDENSIRLPNEVIDEHANFHFGGTCFSLTFFLETILMYYGYQCYPVMGDMKAGRNIHCALITILNNRKYLLDPGYLLNEPMEINAEKPRLYRSAGVGVELHFNAELAYYQLFTFNKDQKTWRYNFRDIPCPKHEFLSHWQASFTRSSMHGICLTKIQKHGLIYIHKNFMRETTFTSKQNFNIKKNYHGTIKNIFGINEEYVEEARSALRHNLEMEKKLGIFIPREKKK